MLQCCNGLSTPKQRLLREKIAVGKTLHGAILVFIGFRIRVTRNKKTGTRLLLTTVESNAKFLPDQDSTPRQTFSPRFFSFTCFFWRV